MFAEVTPKHVSVHITNQNFLSACDAAIKRTHGEDVQI